MIFLFIYTIIVLAFNLAFGFTGLVNLGHMVFFGIGAYASAMLTLNGVPWYVALPSAGLAAAIIGALIAAVTVRLKGDYFQIVTLGMVFIAVAVFRNWTEPIAVFGLELNARGSLGLNKIPPILKSDIHYLFFVIGISMLCAVFFYWLAKSQTGKIFQAIRDDETAASVLGKNTYLYKVLSITISTFFAGIAGSLLIHFMKVADPSLFDLEYFVLILSMLIVGGLASIQGSVIGVFFIGIIVELMRFIDKLPFLSVILAEHPELIGASRTIIYSLIVVYILIFRPRGLFGKVDV